MSGGAWKICQENLKSQEHHRGQGSRQAEGVEEKCRSYLVKDSKTTQLQIKHIYFISYLKTTFSQIRISLYEEPEQTHTPLEGSSCHFSRSPITTDEL